MHPHADSDGLVRDGLLREAFFRLKVHETPPVEVLVFFFMSYNEKFFEGKLSAPSFEVIDQKDLCGQFNAESVTLRLNIEQFSGYEWFRDTLLHEMCHQWVRCVEKNLNEESHGERWSNKARELGVRLPGEPPR